MVEEHKQDAHTMMQDALQQFETGFNAVNEDELRRLAEEDIRDADDIDCEVSNYCNQAKVMMDMACDIVAGGIKARSGRAGCLHGQVEDYVHRLDDMIAKKDAAFASNRDRLQRVIKMSNTRVETAKNHIKVHLSGIQEQIAKIYNPPPPLKVELRNIKNFGSTITDHRRNFRWAPSVEYLESLGEPLRLTAIRTKGRKDSICTAIQLVFHNELESDFIDTKSSMADEEVSTVQITSHKIRKIISCADGGGYLVGKARVEYEDGQQTTFYDKNYGSYQEQERNIPEDSYIVGVYGRLESSYLYFVGFIVAKYD